MDDILENIKWDIKFEIETNVSDWMYIGKELGLEEDSKSSFEKLQIIENFISENFSFESNTSNAYVYFGTDGKIQLWQCVREICKDRENDASYISSSEAGKLFNDGGFYEFLCYVFKDDESLLKKENGIQALFEGYNASGIIGKLSVIEENGEKTLVSVPSLNDFFRQIILKELIQIT